MLLDLKNTLKIKNILLFYNSFSHYFFYYKYNNFFL